MADAYSVTIIGKHAAAGEHAVGGNAAAAPAASCPIDERGGRKGPRPSSRQRKGPPDDPACFQAALNSDVTHCFPRSSAACASHAPLGAKGAQQRRCLVSGNGARAGS